MVCSGELPGAGLRQTLKPEIKGRKSCQEEQFF